MMSFILYIRHFSINLPEEKAMKNIHEFLKKKQGRKKITMITCYDYTSAKIVNHSKIDCILVGDTSIMLMHGEKNTTQADIKIIETHTRAVSKGAFNKFIVADLPFMSYRKSLSQTMENVEKLIRAGAQAIKLEGAVGNLETIKYITDSGIPVMGHIGLTPQHFHALGGFKIQGKHRQEAVKLLEEAKALEKSGCFAIVLECVPSDVAKKISQALLIPTIGIGAGPDTDGQVLVFHDLLGLQSDFKPKFLKTYLNGEELFIKSINQYVSDVQLHIFPGVEHSYEGEAK
jgi:3-methyl-2-oxobutanoate hydroxymethyltransferase